LARKILLADDSVTAQNMGRKILADAGYEVITVNNGSAALKKIAELHPDVIVLDVYMPGYSGLEVCQRLKESGDTSRIPILLTVGKLEPFKPEEAKRVRADGFIVKPFEASELLSALTKLEDKIVPRTETSKPGRFSRAMSDEPKYDKTMAPDEDTGWKNRISFPSKKKAKEVEADDPVAFEASSKDVRAVIEQMPVTPPTVKTAEEKFDLGALAPEGLPKDVTPEEIAALAAAAARVKGKISEEKPAEPATELAVVAPAEVESSKQEAPSATEPAPTPEVIAVFAAAAELKAEPPQAEPKITAGPSEVEAAIATLEKDSATQAAHSADGSSSQTSSAPSDEPVTMAVSAASDSTAPASRWAAVAVALAPEEAGISLEQEMQKAYAAYAGAESGHSGSASTVAVAGASATLPSQSIPSEPSLSVSAITAPEVAQALSAVASAATEAVSAAVKELENVASLHAGQSASSIPPSEESTQPAASFLPEVVMSESSVPQPPVEATAASAETVKSETAEAVESKTASDAVAIEAKSAPAVSESASTASFAEGAGQAASEFTVANLVETHLDRTADAAHKESEATAISAASSDAQIQGHESDNGHARLVASPSVAESSHPQDVAAMAAAVGGTNAIEEIAAAVESDPSIASIVDSVLADLRPKIVEEISRKLGKKK
jgi:CheY-like chemotaxis protein